MGAGDVKLMAGVGRLDGPSADPLGVRVLGAGGRADRRGDDRRLGRCDPALGDVPDDRPRDPARSAIPLVLAERAGERKKTMMLLPYGIPIAVGSIAYFGWMGLFF